MNKNYFIGLILVIGVITLIATFVLAKPGVVPATTSAGNTVIVPAHAVEVSNGVFSLGTARDVDGRVVQGFLFIDDRRENAKPTCNNNGICEAGEKKSCSDCKNGGGEDPTPKSTCFSLFAKGARWKETEQYITDGVDPTLTETSLETWDSEVSFNIFGTGTAGTTDGADDVSPDGENEVMFENLGATSTIAYTIVWGIFRGPPGGRELVEWDAVFNSDYAWSTSGESNKMDYQNIATHEFGHAVGLGHPSDSCTEETMYRFAESGETKKRTLEDGDIAGVNELY